MFEEDAPILITFEKMHVIFQHIHQACARLLIELMGLPEPPGGIEGLRGVAIMMSSQNPFQTKILGMGKNMGGTNDQT